MEMKKFFKNRRLIKGAAAVAAIAIMATAALIPAKTEEIETIEPAVLQPDPVVMILEEPADAVVEETYEEEEQRKLSFFQKLKIAVYGFFAVCAGWIVHKIPWKKIFNKRNLIIAAVLLILGVAMYYVGIPMMKEYFAAASN